MEGLYNNNLLPIIITLLFSLRRQGGDCRAEAEESWLPPLVLCRLSCLSQSGPQTLSCVSVITLSSLRRQGGDCRAEAEESWLPPLVPLSSVVSVSVRSTDVVLRVRHHAVFSPQTRRRLSDGSRRVVASYTRSSVVSGEAGTTTMGRPTTPPPRCRPTRTAYRRYRRHRPLTVPSQSPHRPLTAPSGWTQADCVLHGSGVARMGQFINLTVIVFPSTIKKTSK